MSLFTKDMAMDLGTANTLIMSDGKIILNEPSIVAIDKRTEKCIAVGREAWDMYQFENQRIETVRPLSQGTIANFDAAEMLIRGLIGKVLPRKILKPQIRMIIGIPSCSNQVQERAVRESAEHAGIRDVYLIYESMAAAIGTGMNVMEPHGHMIVDIGGGTTEIAVISLGGIVEKSSVDVAGDVFIEDIENFLHERHSVNVGKVTAEAIKIAVGSALGHLDDEPEPYAFDGKNIITSLPIHVEVTYKDVAACLDRSIMKIESAIRAVLGDTPPEMYADIVKNGIWLSGGGALLRGLAERFNSRFNIPFHQAEDPLTAVARGTSLALKDLSYPFLMK